MEPQLAPLNRQLIYARLRSVTSRKKVILKAFIFSKQTTFVLDFGV
jgi:hypothetical protein